MARDNAPIKNTCPIIDDVVRYVDGFYKDFATEYNESDFKDVYSILEHIRNANSTLRDWGNEEYERANELEKQVDELDKENTNLKSDIKYLEDRVKELEEDLNKATEV
jgi:peptidoglycan hydrolase CwlO-like protein